MSGGDAAVEAAAAVVRRSRPGSADRQHRKSGQLTSVVMDMAVGDGSGGVNTTQAGAAAPKIEELRTEELEGLPPLENPERALQKALEKLRGEDWAAQFEAINQLRRLVNSCGDGGPHDASSTLSAQLHPTLLLLKEFADSLRSTLSKNAVICFKELFVKMGPKMEAHLDVVVPLLIKKSSESNGFIGTEADRSSRRWSARLRLALDRRARDVRVAPQPDGAREGGAPPLDASRRSLRPRAQSRDLERIVPLFRRSSPRGCRRRARRRSRWRRTCCARRAAPTTAIASA